MLDKSIEFYRIILKREKGTKAPIYELPKGYKFVFFKKGDEESWAKIETSVNEFSEIKKALKYFKKKYLPYIDKLRRRTIFVENEFGEKVATFTAWWNYLEKKRYPSMHWVACKPKYQGLGIGKALIAYGTCQMIELEGDCTMYIPTQTWSHRAINIYIWAGFHIVMDDKQYGSIKNQAIKGYEIIKDLI